MTDGAHSNLMAQIQEMGAQEEATHNARVVHAPDATASSTNQTLKPSPKSRIAGIGEFSTKQDGTLTEEWDPYLPRPPSMRQLNADDNDNSGAEQVAVFNANTQEGSTMVKVLSEKGLRVVAAVRVFTSKNTKALIKLKGVTVKVADWSDEASLLKVTEGCSRAFVVTKYWEKFDSKIEEQMAMNILKACHTVSPPIQHLVLATFEDTKELKARGRKSQLVPTRDGRIFPRFDGKARIDKMGKENGIQITHMMTSYLDEDDQKKSLILIRGDTGRIIVQPFFQEAGKPAMM
jgi:NmrA-like family